MKAKTKSRSVITRETNGRNFIDTDPDRVSRIIAKSAADQDAKRARRQKAFNQGR